MSKNPMKTIPVEESVGTVLCQDITEIVPGKFKGVLFSKGHIIKKEDIPRLLDVGKSNLYVWELKEGDIHENEASLRLAVATSGQNISYDMQPKEGKVGLFATQRGLFTVNSDLLLEMNMVESVTMASLPKNYPVEAGQKVAGVRVVPLVVPNTVLETVEQLAFTRGKVFNVLPYKPLICGVVTTGSEVYLGRIKDKFGPVMKEKIDFFGGRFLGQIFCPDNMTVISQAIDEHIKNGADLIILTGGMSVDPDDMTPGAIRATGAHVITYGAPVQPGNMMMLGYLGNTTLLGVPGCAMYSKTTVLDSVLCRIFAGVRLTKLDFARMGDGGLCQSCEVCTYPKCYFCR